MKLPKWASDDLTNFASGYWPWSYWRKWIATNAAKLASEMDYEWFCRLKADPRANAHLLLESAGITVPNLLEPNVESELVSDLEVIGPAGLDTVRGWPFIELPGYREHPESATYATWKSAPPIPSYRLSHDFSWLLELPPNSYSLDGLQWVEEKVSRWKKFVPSHLDVLVDSANEVNLTIPQAFVTFLKSPNLLTRLPSCTGVFFKIPSRLIELQDSKEDRLLCFAHDYQGCLYWHLYLRPTDYCIVATGCFFGGIDDFDCGPDDESEFHLDRPTVKHFCIVENTFEGFIYRYWIENQIWFALERGDLPTQEQLNYARYYLTQPSPLHLD